MKGRGWSTRRGTWHGTLVAPDCYHCSMYVSEIRLGSFRGALLWPIGRTGSHRYTTVASLYSYWTHYSLRRRPLGTCQFSSSWYGWLGRPARPSVHRLPPSSIGGQWRIVSNSSSFPWSSFLRFSRRAGSRMQRSPPSRYRVGPFPWAQSRSPR